MKNTYKNIKEYNGWIRATREGHFPFVIVSYFRELYNKKLWRVTARYENFGCPDFFRELEECKSKKEAKRLALTTAAEFARGEYLIYKWRDYYDDEKLTLEKRSQH